MTTYAAGLRLSEVIALKLTDLDSQRQMIRVEQGKGRKDRYTILSPKLLEELRLYWKMCRPISYLFPGRDPHRPMDSSAAQRIYYAAKQRAGIQKGLGIHTLRHYAESRIMPSGTVLSLSMAILGFAYSA
jgi:integrase